jgi:hypothetical protein
MNGWIGVDLDGTLAEYHGWQGIEHIGAPIPLMLERVKNWIEEGIEVRIFTARVHEEQDEETLWKVFDAIQTWCYEHIGEQLKVTNKKDFQMYELWDDRAIQVIPNKGLRVDGLE